MSEKTYSLNPNRENPPGGKKNRGGGEESALHEMIYPRYRRGPLLRPRPPFTRMNLNLVELDVLHVEAYQIKEVLKVIFPSTLVTGHNSC